MSWMLWRTNFICKLTKTTCQPRNSLICNNWIQISFINNLSSFTITRKKRWRNLKIIRLTQLIMILSLKTWFQWVLATCLKFQKSSFYSKIIKCNNHKKVKVPKTVIKLLIFPRFRQLMILYKPEFTIMIKALETKAKVRNKEAIRKGFIIGLRQLHFQCQVRVVQQLIQWTQFRIIQTSLSIRITITLSYQHMELVTQGSMPQQVISFKEVFRMEVD